MERLEAIYKDCDSAGSYAGDYRTRMAELLAGIDPHAVEQLTTIVSRACDEDKTVFILGNGGSGAVAGHWVNDLGPNTVVDGKPGFRVMSLTDNASSVTAVANDASYDAIFEIQLCAFMRPRDVVIGLSVSGNSPNVVRAIEYANENGAFTAGLSGMEGGKLKEIAEVALHFPSSRDEYGPVEDLFSVVMHMVTSYLTLERGRRLAH